MHDLPLERDEGAYAAIAMRWLAGDVLYRDLFDHKPPLVYVVFALARLLSADPVRGIRLLATLYLLASGVALMAVGWRLYGRYVALIALGLFLAYGSSPRFQGLTFNSEAVLTLPAIVGCLLAVTGVQKRRVALFGLAGVCVGFAIAAKPVGVALLVPLHLAPLLLSWPRRSRLAAIVLGNIGALLPLLLFALLLWQQGALPAAYEALIRYNRLYAAESLVQGWDPTWLGRIWAPMLTLVLPAAAGLATTWRQRDWRTIAQLAGVLWGLTLLATALLSLRAYPHYYLAAVPFLSLWTGAGVVVVIKRLGAYRGWMAGLAGTGILMALLAPPVYEIWPLRKQSPYEQIGSLYGVDGYIYFGTAADVAAYVIEHVPGDQAVFVWAAEPEIYYLANRRPATPFVYDYPVERIPGAREQMLNMLREAPPPLIITYHNVRPMGFHPFMLDYGYELGATIGGYDLYERSIK